MQYLTEQSHTATGRLRPQRCLLQQQRNANVKRALIDSGSLA